MCLLWVCAKRTRLQVDVSLPQFIRRPRCPPTPGWQAEAWWFWSMSAYPRENGNLLSFKTSFLITKRLWDLGLPLVWKIIIFKKNNFIWNVLPFHKYIWEVWTWTLQCSEWLRCLVSLSTMGYCWPRITVSQRRVLAEECSVVFLHHCESHS